MTTVAWSSGIHIAFQEVNLNVPEDHMKTVKTTSLVAVVATGLILFFTPLPVSGGGCGGSDGSSKSSGCQSNDSEQAVAPESNRDLDGLIMRQASIEANLTQDLATLEYRLIQLAANADSEELRTQCEDLSVLVVTIRGNVSQYRAVGDEIMLTAGHAGWRGGSGQGGSALSANGGHDH